MNKETTIKLLYRRPEDISLLVGFFEDEWPEYYGDYGPGNAFADLQSYANKDVLPIGLVAYVDDAPSGFIALKQESITSRSHLGPWVAAGYVVPHFRGRGIGAKLLAGIEGIAAASEQFSKIYSGTSKAHNLLLRAGWSKEEELVYDGVNVTIYSKQL